MTRVGFLHAGGEGHGVRRYGRLLAEAMRGRADVVEHDLGAVEAPLDAGRVRDAAAELAGCDRVHLQYNRAVWGEAEAQIANLAAVLDALRPPVVATLHDVYLEDPWDPFKSDRSWLARWRRRRRAGRRLRPVRQAIAMLLARCARTLVCFETERARLAGMHGFERVAVIPHFVERRPNLPRREEARARLGISGPLITALGFIHPRKGYDLALEAVQSSQTLAEGVTLAFAGAPSPGNEPYLRKLVRQAQKSGARAVKLIATGWLPEGTLEDWLAATDVGLCPFRFFSASGSLTTWISAARPVVCHALPQIEEYRAVEPAAFSTFAPYRAPALAAALEAALDRAAPEPDPAMARLRERCALEKVARMHLDLDLGAVRHPRSPRR